MKPASFRYFRATTAMEASQALGDPEVDGNVRVLAGGQSLVPALSSRSERPALVVDIMGCRDLGDLSLREERLHIGATVPQAIVEASSLVRERCPLIKEALGWVAMPQVRSRGTVVGSLVQANPGAELPVVAIVLNAVFDVLGCEGMNRVVTAQDLYAPASDTTLRRTDLVLGTRFRVLRENEGWGFAEIQLRKAHFALVCAAATVTVAEGSVVSAAIAVGGLTANPFRSRQAEATIEGSSINDHERVRTAAALAVSDRPSLPREDQHASAEYRLHAAQIVVRRALASACSRAQGALR